MLTLAVADFAIRLWMGASVLLLAAVLTYAAHRLRSPAMPDRATRSGFLANLKRSNDIRDEHERMYPHGRPPAHIPTEVWDQTCEAVKDVAVALGYNWTESTVRTAAGILGDRIAALQLFPPNPAPAPRSEAVQR